MGGGYEHEVIEFACSLLENPEYHYEKMVGSLQERYLNSRKFGSEYHSMFSEFLEYISIIFVELHQNADRFFETSIPLYKGLGVLAKKVNPLWIFSLNHDICIEILANAHGIPIKCGFGGDKVAFPRRDASYNTIGEVEFETVEMKLFGAKMQTSFVRMSQVSILSSFTVP